jgi:hypothetical protein
MRFYDISSTSKSTIWDAGSDLGFAPQITHKLSLFWIDGFVDKLWIDS